MRNGLILHPGMSLFRWAAMSPSRVFRHLQGCTATPRATRIFNLMDVELLLMQKGGGSPPVGYKLADVPPAENDLAFWTSRKPVHRAWIVHSVRRVEGCTRIAAALTAPGFDPGRTAIISGHAQDGQLSKTVLEVRQSGRQPEGAECAERHAGSYPPGCRLRVFARNFDLLRHGISRLEGLCRYEAGSRGMSGRRLHRGPDARRPPYR